MVGNIKREHSEIEEPAALLTPESTPGKNSGKRRSNDASSEDSSPASPPSKKRTKAKKTPSSRSKVRLLSNHMRRCSKPVCYELFLSIGRHLNITEKGIYTN